MRSFLTAVLLSCAIFPVTAQEQHGDMCGPWKEMRAELKKQYDETPSFAGQSRAPIVLFTARNGETFTLVVVWSPLRACVLVSGDGWAELPEQLKGDPS